jgi:hypothetical protein
LAAANAVASIAFDPTGHRLATVGLGEGTIKLWFAFRLQQPETALGTDQGATSSVVFEPRGAGLLAVDGDGNSFTWPTSLSAWERHACSVAVRNLTRQEWSRLVADYPYTAVCP